MPLSRHLAIAFAIAACGREGHHEAASITLPGAQRVAIGDLDGDGHNEIITVDATLIHVLTPTGREIATAPALGGIQILMTTDLDGDGRAELYAGWGQTRDHRDTLARITVHRLQGSTLASADVTTPTTSRPDVVAIVPMLDTHQLLVAYFESKYMVTSAIATPGPQGWSLQPLATIRTATTYARGDVDGDHVPDIVVGRVYGDDVGIDGDAFILRPEGTRTPLPTTRGLRSLALADTDGDGALEIFMGDGWHQNYAAQAHGLVTHVVRHPDGTFASELVEDTAKQYEVSRILPAHAGSTPAIVTMGSTYVRVFTRTNTGWKGRTLIGAGYDIAVGDLDGVPGDELVVVGDHSKIVKL